MDPVKEALEAFKQKQKQLGKGLKSEPEVKASEIKVRPIKVDVELKSGEVDTFKRMAAFERSQD